MSDADLTALRANAERLSTIGSPVQMATAADLIPIIDTEVEQRLANKPAPIKKPRAPVKKKVVPATGHQTALPEASPAG